MLAWARANQAARGSPPGRQERPVRRVEAEPSKLGALWDGCVQIFFSTPRPRARPRSPPGERSSRARSLLDRWQKQRGKTPSLAATRGHTTALGHLGCHKNGVMEPCFGRRARRAAHVSDPRRWKEVNPKGVTAAARRCRASLLTTAQPGRRSSPPGRQEDPCGELGQSPRRSSGCLGRPRSNFFFLSRARRCPQASATE